MTLDEFLQLPEYEHLDREKLLQEFAKRGIELTEDELALQIVRQ